MFVWYNTSNLVSDSNSSNSSGNYGDFLTILMLKGKAKKINKKKLKLGIVTTKVSA